MHTRRSSSAQEGSTGTNAYQGKLFSPGRLYRNQCIPGEAFQPRKALQEPMLTGGSSSAQEGSTRTNAYQGKFLAQEGSTRTNAYQGKLFSLGRLYKNQCLPGEALQPRKAPQEPMHTRGSSSAQEGSIGTNTYRGKLFIPGRLFRNQCLPGEALQPRKAL